MQMKQRSVAKDTTPLIGTIHYTFKKIAA